MRTLPPAAPSAPSPAPSVITTHPMLGTFGVLLGAMIATCTGRLMSVGLADLRGALHLGVDEASWIGTAFNASLMFIGPFSVYLGGLLGPRRVLLACASAFTLFSVLLPFAPNLPTMIVFLILAGLTAGTFYPLTLSFVLRNLPMRYVLLGIAAYAFDILVTTNVSTSLEAFYISHFSWRWIFWSGAVLTPVMMAFIYWYSVAAAADSKGRAAATQLARISLRQLRIQPSLHRARPGPAPRLAALRHHRWTDRRRHIPSAGNRSQASIDAEPARQRAIYRQAKHVAVRCRIDPLPLHHAYAGSRDSELPQLRKRYLPLQTGPVLLWIAIPQCILGLLAIYLLKFIDARVILTIGFGLVSIACMLNAQITSAWSGSNFLFSQAILAVGLAFAFNAMVGSIILEAINTGALTRPVDILTFAGYFQTVRLLGGEAGAAFMQHFIPLREQFHSNILGLNVSLGHQATDQRLMGLSAGMKAHSPNLVTATERAGILLSLQIRQQAFTLAISDSFILLASAAACCLFFVACMKQVPTQYRQITSPPAKPA